MTSDTSVKKKLKIIFRRFLELLKGKNRKFNLVVQILISIALITLLLQLVDIPDMVSLFKSINPVYLILLLLLISFDRVFMAYKWHMLLKVKNMSISFFSAVRNYYIATFIGFFLPTTVGGDLVRVLKLRSEKKSGTDVLSSVILERMLGFLASAILAPIAAFFLIAFYKVDIWRFLMIAGILLLVFITLVLIPFNNSIYRRIDRNKKLSRNALFIRFKKLYQSYIIYKDHKRLIFLFLFLSILEQLVPVVANYLASLALNLSIPFVYFLLVVPLIQLISRTPISFEGVGVNEGLMVYFFSLLGLSVTGAFSIGLLGHISVIIAALPAVYFYYSDIRASYRANG